MRKYENILQDYFVLQKYTVQTHSLARTSNKTVIAGEIYKNCAVLSQHWSPIASLVYLGIIT